MKISFNALKNFLEIKESPEEIANLITEAGLEVSSIKKLVNPNSNFEGVVIGEVFSIENHPNADVLRIAKVFIGNEIFLQIVCSAPNLRVGQRVALAKAGCEIINSEGEKIKIKEAKIRGEKSFGMLCSEYEIGIGIEKDLILDLEENFKVGDSIKNYINFFDDTIFDVEITPNRGDACSHYGIARDLSAILNKKLISPKIFDIKSLPRVENFSLEIMEKEACPAFFTLLVKGVRGLETPNWIKKFLKNVGIAPKFLMVDITNFIMLYLGQPMHAYDFEKLKTKKLTIKYGKGEDFYGLDKKKRKVEERNLIICDGESVACIAGVIGGYESAVSEETDEVLLESAYFDSKIIRRSSKILETSTDSSFRFERGIGDTQKLALELAVETLKEISDKVTFFNSDSFSNIISEEKIIIIRLSRLHKIAGVILEERRVLEILEFLNFSPKKEGDNIKVKIPLIKSDVCREIDVIEEVMRVYGYNKISKEKNYTKVFFEKQSDLTNESDRVSNMLISEGFFEILTNPLVSSTEILNDKFFDENNLVKLKNPSSLEFACMRPNLIYSFLKVAQFNLNRDVNDLSIFEFGKEYSLVENFPVEKNILALLITQKVAQKDWRGKKEKINLYSAFYVVEKIFKMLGVSFIREVSDSAIFFSETINYFSDTQKSEKIAKVHTINREVLKRYDLPEETFFMEMDGELFHKKKDYVKVTPVPKFPECFRDLSFFTEVSVSFLDFEKIINSLHISNLKNILLTDVYKNKSDSENKSYTFRFFFQSDVGTLSSEYLDKEMKKIEEILVRDLNVKIR